MSIEQKLCKEKILQIQSMFNVIICMIVRFAAKNLGISYMALTFNLSKLKMKILHAKINSRLQDMSSHT